MKSFHLGLLLTVVSLYACDLKRETTAVPVSRSSIGLASSNIQDSVPGQERTFTFLDREIAYLMNIWPGEYDNVEQLDFHKYATQGKRRLHPQRIHATVRKVANSALGHNVLFVQEHVNDEPRQITHQALYHIVADEDNRAIRVEVFEFKDKQIMDDREMDKVSNFSRSSSQVAQLCDMQMTHQDQFYAGHPADGCTTEEYGLRIRDGEFYISRSAYAEGLEHQLEKARCFICMIDFPREDGGRPVHTVHYVPILDQGGKFSFDYLDGRHMILGMRNTWSYGMQRETFVIFIQEGSQEGPTLIYSWGEPGADRIGFNPGWIRVQCDLDTPTNRQLQHDLRPDS